MARILFYKDIKTLVIALQVVVLTVLVISVSMSSVGGIFATASGDMRARIWRYSPFGGSASIPSKKSEDELRPREAAE